MEEQFQRWGVFHYKTHRKRRQYTLIATFDSPATARNLMLSWKSRGPVFVGPCSANEKPDAKGITMLYEHNSMVRPCGKEDPGDPTVYQFNSPNFADQGA